MARILRESIAKARALYARRLAEPGFPVRGGADLLHRDFRKLEAAAGRSGRADAENVQWAAELLREKAENIIA